VLVLSALAPDSEKSYTHRQVTRHFVALSAQHRGHYDAEVTTRGHISATIRTCFATLRQVPNVWRSLAGDALLTFIHLLVVSRFDYCSSVLASVPEVHSNRKCIFYRKFRCHTFARKFLLKFRSFRKQCRPNDCNQC
jgi:hypothetical protein